AQITGKYPIRVLMLNLNVQPMPGVPALSQAVQFLPAEGLGQPTLTASQAPANYAAAWLDNTVAGVSGTNLIGNLLVTIPGNAPADASYQVEFEHVSASPNGLALLPQSIQQAVLPVTTTNVTSNTNTNSTGQTNAPVSSWGD